jgi:hypothetical protein
MLMDDDTGRRHRWTPRLVGRTPAGFAAAPRSAEGVDEASALPAIMWLLSQSPTYRAWRFGDVAEMVRDVLRSGHYRLFSRNGRPTGVALWMADGSEPSARLVHIVLPFATPEDGSLERALWELETGVFDGQAFRFHVEFGA